MRSFLHSFRPLAGFWFLNLVDWTHGKDKYLEFPSPCGVLVLKYYFSHMENGCEAVFPSPCGVLVLKSEKENVYHGYQFRFRPLAGFWFLNWGYGLVYC